MMNLFQKSFLIAIIAITNVNFNATSQTCNCPLTSTIISNANGNTNSSFFGSNISSGVYCIQDNFTIDQNFTINSCELLIAPGKKIIVNPKRTLTLTDPSSVQKTWLHACGNKMWDRIELQGTTNINKATLIANKGTLIEDAEVAVSIANEYAEYKIIDCVFNRNNESIFIDCASLLSYNGSSTVENTNFYCRTNPYTSSNCNCLLTPFAGLRSSSFVRTDHVLNNTIVGKNNIFDNAEIANDFFYSFMISKNNQFANCRVGIHSSFDGKIDANNNIFSKCKYGVECENYTYEIDILNNNLDIVDIGIYLHDNSIDHAIVKYNTISNIKNTGIQADNHVGGYIDIGYNILTNNSTQLTTGISINQIIPDPTIRFRVYNNDISGFNNGIYGNMIDNSRIMGNNIQMPNLPSYPGYPLFGIRTDLSARNAVYYNYISNSDITHSCDDWYHGIIIDNCAEHGIYCNTLYNFGRQITLMHNLPGIQVFGNKMYGESEYCIYILDCIFGLGNQGISPSFSFPPGSPSDNEWHGYGAGCIDPNGWPGVEIFSQNSNYLPSGGFTRFHVRNTAPYFQPNVTGFIGFDVLLLSSFPYTAPTICETIHAGERNMESGNQILNNQNNWQNGEDAQKWINESWLYSLIKNDSILIADSIFGNWFLTKQGGSYNAFSAYSGSASTVSSQNPNLSGLLTFTPQNNIETDLQSTIQMVSDYFSNGSFTLSTQQKNDIDSLAIQCPTEKGPAVYIARALRNTIDKFSYCYALNCNSPNVILRTAVNINGTSVINKTILKVIIYDVNGRLIKETNTLPLPSNDELPHGFYLIKQIFTDGTILNNKIIF